MAQRFTYLVTAINQSLQVLEDAGHDKVGSSVELWNMSAYVVKEFANGVRYVPILR